MPRVFEFLNFRKQLNCSLSSSRTMEQLPDLALLAIFRHLGIRSLATCRLVSKRFKYCADQIKPEEIVLSEIPVPDDKWRYRDEPVAEDCTIYDYDVNVLRKISFGLQRLKSLKIGNYALYQDLDEFIDFLNATTIRLVHLEIVGISLKQPATLSLALLEVLFIDWPEGKSTRITVTAPKLRVLSYFGTYGSLSALTVTHPKSIEHLELFDRADESIRQFENVETLRIFLPRFIDPKLLAANANLKTIFLLGQNEWDLLYYDQTREIVEGLFEQKRQTARDDLKIHFFDQLLDESKPFDDYQIRSKFADYFVQSDSEDE